MISITLAMVSGYVSSQALLIQYDNTVGNVLL